MFPCVVRTVQADPLYLGTYMSVVPKSQFADCGGASSLYREFGQPTVPPHVLAPFAKRVRHRYNDATRNKMSDKEKRERRERFTRCSKEIGPEEENFPVHVLNSGHSTRGTVTWPDSLLAAKPAELLSVC